MILKLFTILSTLFFSQAYNIRVLTENDKKLDKGVEEVEVQSEEQEEEYNQNQEKLYLYQRVKLSLDQSSTIFLNYGLNNSTLSSVTPMDFKLDVGFSEVLVNVGSRKCKETENCYKQETESKQGEYRGIEYEYQDAKIFLGVNRVRPGEINSDNNEELQNFYNLPIQLYSNTEEFEDNILGLGPKSPIWNYWKNLYHFPNNHINITLCYNEENEYMMFDSYIDMDNEILFRVDKDKSVYAFDGFMKFNESKEKLGELLNSKICIGNEQGLTMKLSKHNYDDIMNALCKNPAQCDKASHLKQASDISLELQAQDHLKKDKIYDIKFYSSSFYEIQGESIIWRIEETSDTEDEDACDIILEQEFFKEKYLLISNNIKDEKHIYVGFKLIHPSDFSNVDFFFISICILSVIAVSLLIVYIILNNQLNKLIEKEEKESEE